MDIVVAEVAGSNPRQYEVIVTVLQAEREQAGELLTNPLGWMGLHIGSHRLRELGLYSEPGESFAVRMVRWRSLDDPDLIGAVHLLLERFTMGKKGGKYGVPER